MTTLVKQQHAGLHLETARVSFKHILLAVDFGEGTENALSVAARVAKRFGGELHVLNVVPAIVYSEQPVYQLYGLKEHERSASMLMKALVDKPLLAGIHRTESITVGMPVESILQSIQENHIDLVILATRAPGGLEKLVLGSVAEAVVRKAPCPVLVVGPNVNNVLMPFRSIVFATSLEPTSLRAGQYAVALAEDTNAAITLLHVTPPAFMGPGKRRTVRAEIFEHLRELLPADAECWCQPKVRVEEGESAPTILEAAKQDSADLIVMSTHDRNILADHAPWATFTKVVRDAHCPVLAVREHIS